MVHLVRIAVFAVALCIGLPAQAGESVAADTPQTAPFTIAQSREAQALFGFDAAIPVIIEQSFKEQPEYAALTPMQRECVIGVASPAFHSLFDDAFIQLFGDSGILDAWKTFAETAGGKLFVDNIRRSAMLKINGEPEPDASATIAAMSDSQRADISAFFDSRAATILGRRFPEVGMTPESKTILLARTQQECGVTLDHL